MGAVNSFPKLFLLTLNGASKVSFVLAPSRAISPRLVRKAQLGAQGCTCANADDSNEMQTTSRVMQNRRRIAAAVVVIESSLNPGAAPWRLRSRGCDTKWHISWVPPIIVPNRI